TVSNESSRNLVRALISSEVCCSSSRTLFGTVIDNDPFHTRSRWERLNDHVPLGHEVGLHGSHLSRFGGGSMACKSSQSNG
ncbi:MAG: hypothetical protein ACLGJA_26220, partial [Gammaproteobacteria bacterium]